MHTGPQPIHLLESRFLIPRSRLEDLHALLVHAQAASTRDSWCQLFLDTRDDDFLRREVGGEVERPRVVLRATESQPGVVLDVGHEREEGTDCARWWIPVESWAETLDNPESPLAQRFRKMEVHPRVAVRGRSAFWFLPEGRVEVMVELSVARREDLDLEPGDQPWQTLDLRTADGEPAALITATGEVDLGEGLPLEACEGSLYLRARETVAPH